MKHSRHVRITALLLCLALLAGIFSGCGAAVKNTEDDSEDVGPKRYKMPARTPVAFSEMSYSNYDAEAANAALDDLEALCEEDDESVLKQMKEDYDIIVDQHDALSTDYAIVDILYYQDYTNEEISDLLTELELEATELGDRILTVLSEVLASPNGAAMEKYINSDLIVADADGYEPMEDAEFELTEQESNLVQDYYDLLADESATSDQGAELYLALLDILIQEAAYEEDYDNYAEYAYDVVYMRDYTPDQTASLYQWTKDFVIPYYYEIVNALLGDYDNLMNYYDISYEPEEIFAMVGDYLSSVSDTAAEAYDTMLSLDLIDIAGSDTKNDGGFTTTLSYYGVPFIFNCPYETVGDVGTVIHEFGHFYEAYTNMCPQMYAYDCIDTCEVDSQGLEMLMLTYADEIYGEDMSHVARLYSIYSLLCSIIDGCIFDEFQQKALAARMDGTLTTPEQVTELYREVESSYFGEDEEWGDSWYQVPHTFNSPFYYISYATSATAALGLLVMADEDYDNALALYNELIDMGNSEGFVNTLDTLGLPNPLTEEGQSVLSDGLSAYLDEVE